MVFPLPLVQALISESAQSVMMAGRAMGFEVDGARIWSQAPQQAWDNFPKKQLRAVLAQARKANEVLTCSLNDLKALCQDFSSYLSNVPSTEWEVVLKTGGKGGVSLHARTPYAEFNDCLKVTSVTSAVASVSLNLSLLAPIVDFLSTREETVQIVETPAFCGLRAGKHEFLLSRKA